MCIDPGIRLPRYFERIRLIPDIIVPIPGLFPVTEGHVPPPCLHIGR
jgi:hypothetical protein